ncbi:MAG TPA: chromosome segregation protein SMC [Terriglobia bacterium]|nr:chromosome segregation protein SMC [Terriglobia bacterium]
MFKLKRVELIGFKSFADRSRLEFGSGTAAIVGPNGCGKSNVGDAINWVLGEQSPRTLRGDRMADLIFNGTRLRPATSMAEVSLTLVDAKALEGNHPVKALKLPLSATPITAAPHEDDETSSAVGSGNNESVPIAPQEPSRLHFRDGEIVITRRLFRSGESEYLINGDTCRLRDIQDLFMGTGLGPDSYAIIEQGRIGQILSSKPSDRRSIIEEAAGVSKFRTRKRLAETKLESSRQNLSRVTDILEEVSKQVGSLKRQASKARRYREISTELAERLKLTLTSRLLLLDGQCVRLRRDLGEAQGACALAAQELEGLETREKSAAGRYEELERELVRLREAIAQADLARERVISRLGQIRQQASALGHRREDAEAEQSGLRAEILALEQKSAECSRHAEAVRGQAQQALETADALLARQVDLVAALQDAEQRLDLCRQALLGTVARGAELRNQHVQNEEAAALMDRRAARLESERGEASAEDLRLREELEACRREHENAEGALRTVAGAMQDVAARVEQVRQAEIAGQSTVEARREELSQARARREALGESLARHAYSTESVRRLLAGSASVENGHANGNGSGNAHVDFKPLGVLADFLEVTPGYEEVVEEFLKQELDCVVVERHEDARYGLELLHQEGAGRSTFFVKRLTPNGHGHENGALDTPSMPGVRARVADLVKAEARLGLNGDPVLPSLTHAYVVEDASAAERLASEYPAHHFLTPRGEHYHHRLVSGGKGPSVGPLALRRDFRDLERRVTELEPQLEKARAELAAVVSERAALEKQARNLSAAQVESEKDSLRLTERLSQSEQVIGRSARRLELLETEWQAAVEEGRRLRQRQSEIARELGAVSVEQAQREAEIAATGESVRQLRSQSHHLAQELGDAQARRSALEERSQAAEAERTDLESRLNVTELRRARIEQQMAAWAEEQTALAEESRRLGTQLENVEATRSQARLSMTGLAAGSQQSRQDRDELGPLVESARVRLEAEREKRAACEVALARAESDLNHHAAQCREELNADPADLTAALPAESVLAGEALETAENEVRDLKRRIANLGPINMMALEELQEAETRLTFLETQRQDLLASIEDTSQAIREIDEVSRRQFLEAFQAINAHFAESFRTLFGGGVGAMRLSDESDPESGIDLVAQPPGKRLQNVLLLSGGEKALVALALLIAIFHYTPSPFCILDEVDAPLDDSNVERFTRMIRAMSQTTQFILMTHNKRTMEICPLIYGVTMEEPGVSKLVSVRFETPHSAELPAAASF